MNRKLKITKRTPLWLIVAIAVVGVAQQSGWLQTAANTAQQNQPGLYAVTQFYDGDTIQVDMNGKPEKVRMIGVDTPETHDPRKSVQCYGKAASAFTKQFIGSQSVRLESDPLNTNRDRYGRLLRYVYTADGKLLNAELIGQGYGFAYLSFPFSKQDEFRTLQTNARQSNKGLWGTCQPTPNQYGGFTSNNAN